ncbi:hypothetical protein AALP_AA6G106200 [Arabis alpina]|uniref:Uncharacterized protein n=1 Tax=Arabis alpina TaxID=50452 RepID=A0A087GNE1_ARAAL|nr:hypothetical protein AALP_AA6G106200 [Arabis alpina]
MKSCEEEDQYEFEVEQDEPSQNWSHEEADYKTPLRPEDGYSNSEFEDEPYGGDFDPEPPDCSQDDASQYNWSGEETDQGENHGDSWHDETDSEINLGDEDDDFINDIDHKELKHDGETLRDKPWCEETNPLASLEETEQYGEETWHREAEFVANFEDEDYGEGEHEPRYITFSGHGHGSEAYLRWERDMEDWFSSNKIPEKEKTNCAEETLTEDAFRHWDRDVT